VQYTESQPYRPEKVILPIVGRKGRKLIVAEKLLHPQPVTAAAEGGGEAKIGLVANSSQLSPPQREAAAALNALALLRKKQKRARVVVGIIPVYPVAVYRKRGARLQTESSTERILRKKAQLILKKPVEEVGAAVEKPRLVADGHRIQGLKFKPRQAAKGEMRERRSPRYPLLAIDVGQRTTKIGNLSVEGQAAHQLVVANHVAKQQVDAAD